MKTIAFPSVAPVLTHADAEAQGYRHLAGPYEKSERWMLDNAIADQRRGKRDFVLVCLNPHRRDVLSLYVSAHGSILSAE